MAIKIDKKITAYKLVTDEDKKAAEAAAAPFVSWVSVLFAPIWCACLRCFGDVHLTSLAFGRVTFRRWALKQVTKEVIVG